MNNIAVSRHALYEGVAEILRQRIFTHELKPGQHIDELVIAEEFGISRTPLREALKVLAVEGLVTMRVRRGAYVTEVSEKDLHDVYHLLGILESDVAATVALRASDKELQTLRALQHRLEKATDDAALFFQLNEEYHFRLLELCNNRFMVQTVADLRKIMKLNRHQSLFKKGRINDSLREHKNIMQALELRDGESARRAMQAHFASGLQAALLN